MRILAIRGENLASLAAPFCVDLSAEPIAATGLFAITGETGAGKSTILDALCLALYGRYPRVASGRREEVPDPSGDPIGAQDGRAILRRGAAQGSAAVDFVGQDGVAYRVLWETVRARGRADGRLQADRRTLLRLDDGSAVESGKTAVAERIEALTDLTFDQFRRTVLLAQGEFDAFLLAAEGERAELLEKITGTAVYSEISKRVHAGAETHRGAVKGLELRRDAIGLLDEALRAAVAAEREAVGREVAELSGEQAALREALDLARRIDGATVQVTRAEARLAGAQAAVAAGVGDAERLAELDAVEPLRRPAEELAAAERDLAAAETDLTAALSARTASEARSAEAAASHATALAADAVSEAGFKALGPVWTEAADLDSRISEAAQEATSAAEVFAGATASAAAADGALGDLERRLADAQAAHREAAARLAADTGGAYLSVRAEEAAELFTKRGTLAAEFVSASQARDRAKAEAARSAGLIAQGEEAARAAKASRTEATERRAGRARALDEIGEDAVRARATALDRLIADAREAYPIARRHAESVTILAQAHRDAAAARAALDESGLAIAQATRDEAAAATGRREIAPLADLADESLSQQASYLRSLLVEGQPCPVCGASEHPHRHAPDGLGAIADALRARRGSYDAALAAAGTALMRASAAQAAATARHDEAERAGAEAETARIAASAAYRELFPRLDAARTQAGLAGPTPDGPGPETQAALARLGEAAKAAALPLGVALDAARALRDEIETLTRAIEAAGGAIEAAEDSCAAERDARRTADLAAEREATRAAGLAERIESLGREIAPALSAAALSLADLDRDGPAAARRLARLAADHRALAARSQALGTEAQALVTACAARGGDAAAAREAALKASQDAEARATRLAELEGRRARLLDGEATGPHRTRVNLARKEAADALKRASDDRAVATAAFAATRTAADHAQAHRDRMRDRCDASRTLFRQACGTRSADSVAALLALPADLRSGLRTAADRRSLEAREAEAALATRRADRDALLAGPQIDVAATQVAAAALSEAIGERQRRLGAIASELARDDAARAQAAGLEAEIAAARAEYSAWEAVDEAVGSASGDKFRRFAQGVTLEHLVHLANEQLLALSPRYRLVRGDVATLALHILDRDMGDELRATRSLSGGERFLVSLALALALSGLEGRQSFVDTLFIDEGFGSLDAETLDLAVDALETLQGRGRKVGVITHVAAMIDRIAVQVRVEKRGNGRSVVRVTDAGGLTG